MGESDRIQLKTIYKQLNTARKRQDWNIVSHVLDVLHEILMEDD